MFVHLCRRWGSMTILTKVKGGFFLEKKIVLSLNKQRSADRIQMMHLFDPYWIRYWVRYYMIRV